jgi:hypothetical protein
LKLGVLALATLCAATATWVSAADMPEREIEVREAMMYLDGWGTGCKFTLCWQLDKCLLNIDVF